jgi:hypothetical protein
MLELELDLSCTRWMARSLLDWDMLWTDVSLSRCLRMGNTPGVWCLGGWDQGVLMSGCHRQLRLGHCTEPGLIPKGAFTECFIGSRLSVINSGLLMLRFSGHGDDATLGGDAEADANPESDAALSTLILPKRRERPDPQALHRGVSFAKHGQEQWSNPPIHASRQPCQRDA